jgi:hypothetical protein
MTHLMQWFSSLPWYLRYGGWITNFLLTLLFYCRYKYSLKTIARLEREIREIDADEDKR